MSKSFLGQEPRSCVTTLCLLARRFNSRDRRAVAVNVVVSPWNLHLANLVSCRSLVRSLMGLASLMRMRLQSAKNGSRSFGAARQAHFVRLPLEPGDLVGVFNARLVGMVWMEIAQVVCGKVKFKPVQAPPYTRVGGVSCRGNHAGTRRLLQRT